MKRTSLLIGVTAFTALLLAGCVSQKLTPAGAEVLRAHSLTDVKGCERLGAITTKLSTGASISAGLLAGGGYRTKPGDPQYLNEYLISARNQGAEMGGTHVIATNEAYAGKQEFDVYNCPDTG